MAQMDLGAALASVKTMLSGLTAWQTICGVSTSTEAAKRIYLGGAEDDGELCPCCVIDLADSNAPFEFNRSTPLNVEMRFQLAMPEDQQRNLQTQFIWIWSKCSALLLGIREDSNGSGELMHTGTTLVVKPGPIDPDDNDQRNEWAFTLQITVRII
jgi:hypothetical protein